MLMLPLFFTFFLFVIDFGVMMYGYVSVANAAREGARWASVNCGDGSCTADEIRNRTVERSGGFLSNAADVAVDWPDGGSRGDPVVVKVCHSHELWFFPYSQTIVASTDMRLERNDAGTLSDGSEC
jgi:hypothetical protein